MSAKKSVCDNSRHRSIGGPSFCRRRYKNEDVPSGSSKSDARQNIVGLLRPASTDQVSVENLCIFAESQSTMHRPCCDTCSTRRRASDGVQRSYNHKYSEVTHACINSFFALTGRQFLFSYTICNTAICVIVPDEP